MSPLPAVLLVAAVVILWRFVRGDLNHHRLLRALRDGDARRSRYRLWVARALLFFLLPSLVALALLGRLRALSVMPAEFGPAADWVGPIGLDDGLLVGVGLAAGAAGTLIGTLWTIRRRRAGRAGPMLGDVGALLPRNRGELPYAAALSITAGVAEEAFFRLLLPLLIVLLTGSATAGFGISAILFGAAHRYQGWIGVATTTVMAGFFSAIYLGTQSLWVAMALHMAVDLNGLVLRPAFTGAWARG